MVYPIYMPTLDDLRLLGTLSMIGTVLTARQHADNWIPSWLFGAALALDSFLAVRQPLKPRADGGAKAPPPVVFRR